MTVRLSLNELVEAVQGMGSYVCVRHWCTSIGPSFFEVGVYLEGGAFEPLTPLWSTREAAWRDALARLGGTHAR